MIGRAPRSACRVAHVLPRLPLIRGCILQCKDFLGAGTGARPWGRIHVSYHDTTALAMSDVSCHDTSTLRGRSEERRVGQVGVSTCRSRGAPDYDKKNRKTQKK